MKVVDAAKGSVTLKKTVSLTGVLGTMAGVVSDLLKPLADFSLYIGILSALAFIVFAVLFFTKKNKTDKSMRHKFLAPMLVAAFCMVACTFFYVSQSSSQDASAKGVLASNIPELQSLQQSLGILKKDVGEIKETTARIDKKTDQILASIDKLGQKFESLSKQGAIIDNPKQPEEFYNNARIYELRGDYGNARRAYLEYFKFDLNILDPHLRFIKFLKVQEGLAGARESYQSIVEKSKNDIPKYVALLLLEPGQRVEKLKAYFQAHPDFAPVAYHLAQEYSDAVLGTQSLEDKRQEKKYLEEFKKLDSQGYLVRYFIDQELVAEFRDQADQRLKKLETSIAGNVLQNPVSVTWLASNSQWTGSILIPEPTQEILWKKTDENEFRSTGFFEFLNPVTGKKTPNPAIGLPLNAKATDIEIKYINQHGETAGPFTVSFRPAQASFVEHKQLLGMTKNSWVSFREYDGNLLLYFTHLLAYRGSISKIRYGLNLDKPDQEFAFPSYDKPGIAEIPSINYIKVPKGTSFATVQLTYKDNTESEIVRIDKI